MPADQPKRSVWPIVAVLVLLPVLYVLSFGPAWWLFRSGKWPRSGDWPDAVLTAQELFYVPLIWLCENSEVARALLERYLLLFGL